MPKTIVAARALCAVVLMFLGGSLFPGGTAEPVRTVVEVVIRYPEGHKATEDFPHRFAVTLRDEELDGGPVSAPAEPFPATVVPGATLTLSTAYCEENDPEICFFATVERTIAAGEPPPDRFVIEVERADG